MSDINIRHAIGDTAPEFNVSDVHGKKIVLSKLRNKSVLLVFLRHTGCPWCNLTIHRLILEYPMLNKHNCEIIAFIQSSKEDVLKNLYGGKTKEPQFSIIADVEKKLYDLYKIESSKAAALNSIRYLPEWVRAVTKTRIKPTTVNSDIFLVPATFLISSGTRKIVKAEYGNSFYELESLFSIYESLQFHDS